MHPITQIAIVGCLAALVGMGYMALNDGVPRYDGRTDAQKLNDDLKVLEAQIRPHFCRKVREEVASGKFTVAPGSKAATCL